jgi:hypothetical protein
VSECVCVCARACVRVCVVRACAYLREPTRLDDERRERCSVDECTCFVGRREGLIPRRGDVVPCHELVSERFAAFELSRRRGGTERVESVEREGVYQTVDERLLGSNNHEIDCTFLGPVERGYVWCGVCGPKHCARGCECECECVCLHSYANACM